PALAAVLSCLDPRHWLPPPALAAAVRHAQAVTAGVTRSSGSDGRVDDNGPADDGHGGRGKLVQGRSRGPLPAWPGPELGSVAQPRPASRSHRSPTSAPQ